MVAALHNLAHAMWLRGEPVAALSLLEEALGLTRTHGIAWLTPSILSGIGFASVDLGDYPRALAALHESLRLGQARGNLSDLIDATEGLARLAAAAGQMAQAARFFGAAAARREAGGQPMAPIEIEQLAPSIRAARAALGEEAYTTAWAQGHALSPDEALAEARNLRLDSAASAAEAEPPTADHGLTRREVEILALLAAGQSTREIAEELFISRTTVARHVANLFRKLGVDSRARATAYAHRHGLI
jgi:DNA-binding CsgD family transcriptional regulator